MKRIVDIFKRTGSHQILWTYIVNLGNDGTHPAIKDFESEAMRLAIIDKRGLEKNLIAKVRDQ